MAKKMLARFSLYGFLKNQKYYEPFLILALRDKGLSFFLIGLLIGFRQVWVNLLEIPSGTIADTFGRRRSMIASFIAYIISFVIFATSASTVSLFFAMFFFAVGEAFRTGTHKAMIFDWLASEGRTDEKTRYYGYTRSWSQIGSALSALLAAGAVLMTRNYTAIFWFSVIPYLIAIVNFLGYPSWLDGNKPTDIALGDITRRLVSTFIESLHHKTLRRLFVESAVFRGNAMLSKEYLQPMMRQAAIAMPLFLTWNEERRSAILVGLVYFVLYLVSSVASRQSHRMADRAGGLGNASKWLWAADVLLFAAAFAALWLGWSGIAVAAFAVVVILLNTWRPILMSRIDEVTNAEMGATILSIDSQAGSFYLMIFAPLLGLAADAYGLWPVALFGGITSLFFIGRRPKAE
jgi:MFS family permease